MSKGTSNRRFFFTTLACVLLFYALKAMFSFIVGKFVMGSVQYEQCVIEANTYRECFIKNYNELAIVKLLWAVEVLILVAVLAGFTFYLIKGASREALKATSLLLFFTLVPMVIAYGIQIPTFKVFEVSILVVASFWVCWYHKNKLTKVST